mmetsp:Transcript_982/g.2744  ORF Transcript_982/g.2744 Transcript_982/m.2744 type:complete len:135 (+) Transcript_982:41-445(+)
MDLLSYGSDTEMPLRMMRQNADGHSLDDVPLRMTRRNADGDECIDARLRMCRRNADSHHPEIALALGNRLQLTQAFRRPQDMTESEGAASNSTTSASDVSSAYRSTLATSERSSPTWESTSESSSDESETVIAV